MTTTDGVPVVDVLPMALAVGQAIGTDGNPVTILQITTPHGTHTYPLDGQTARTIGRQLQQAGSAQTAGLILAH